MLVPFYPTVLVLIRRYLPLHAAPAIGGSHRLDWRGLALVALATVSLLNALMRLHDDARIATALLVLGAAALGGFLVNLRRTKVEPLINLSLFCYASSRWVR